MYQSAHLGKQSKSWPAGFTLLSQQNGIKETLQASHFHHRVLWCAPASWLWACHLVIVPKCSKQRLSFSRVSGLGFECCSIPQDPPLSSNDLQCTRKLLRVEQLRWIMMNYGTQSRPGKGCCLFITKVLHFSCPSAGFTWCLDDAYRCVCSDPQKLRQGAGMQQSPQADLGFRR